MESAGHIEHSSPDVESPVLIVDDHPGNRLALRTVLETMPVQIVEARSGEEALEKLRHGEFAVVLLDVKMPGVDGFETARRIRELGGSRHTPIIFISAHDSPQFSPAKAYALGAVDYLVTPVTPEVLRAKVAGLLAILEDVRKARRQAEQFRLLIEGTREYAIFMLDPEGKILTWNPGAERIYGYRADQIIGQHFSSFYPPAEKEVGKPSRELAIAVKRGKYEEECWRLRKDGSRYWASVVITALTDATGRLKGFSKVTRDMTEHKQAEENARRLLIEKTAREAAEASAAEARRAQIQERRQREQLHITLASIGDAVITTDNAAKITFMNPVAEALTGWKKDEAVGRPLDEVFHIINEETRQAVENPVDRSLREGVVVGLANHTVLIARDGSERPIDDSAAPIRGDGALISGVVLVFRDVSEARRAMQARLRLAAIVESSEDAIISHGLDGTILSWNRGAERLYHYTAEEMIGKPLATLVPPEHPDEVPAILDRLRRGERVEHYETTRVRKDGERLQVSLTISPLRDAEARIIGASKIARDITERKRTEQSLRFLADASKLLAALADVPSTLQKVAQVAVPGFADWCTVDIIDEQGALRSVAITHADPAKAKLAKELAERFPPDPDAPHGAWHILRTGQTEFLPYISDALIDESIKDPERRRILRELGLRSYIGVPLLVRGRVIGIVSFLVAESGRRYDQRDLAVAEDLAHRAAITIDNAHLYEELKENARRKDEFLAMLSHELRNPLVPIRNALEILRMPAADAATRAQAHEMMERQLQQLVRLVDDLLDVSRIMRGKIELRKEAVDLAAVVARGIETAQPTIDAQGQQLLTTLPAEPIRMVVDPARVAQIIGNLLHNAAKFSERAGRIWLSAAREGEEAVIRVRDEGIGIPADLLNHIFELFVQGDRSLERSQSGLGIGLTVVQKLVEMHGGRVAVHSGGSGQGSEFVVYLPMHDDAAVPSGPTEAPSSSVANAKTAARRVLVVDDNVDAAQSLAVLLGYWGHQAEIAHSGPQALHAAEKHRPEMIILDIGLPGMSGYDVALALRQKPEFQPVTLVAMTGYGQEDDRRRAKSAGFDYHLTKPVEPEALRRLLDQAQVGSRF